jgi:hypothetical protein
MSISVALSGNNQNSLMEVKKRIEKLGFIVKLYSVPPTLGDWVELPFLREESGSSWFGKDGIEAFIRKHQKET